MKLLILTKKIPFQLMDGESIAIDVLARSLHKQGVEIHMLSMNTSKHEVDVSSLTIPTYCTEFKSVKIDNRISLLGAVQNLIGSDSFHISRFDAENFRYTLKQILERHQFDVVQFESLFLAPYLDLVRENSDAKCSFRSHNVEFKIWENITSQTSNPIKKRYLNLLTKRLKKYELSQLNAFDLFVPISPVDASEFKTLGLKTAFKTIPTGINVARYEDDDHQGNRICFIGSLDWMPNQEGLNWFISKVLPLIKKKMADISFHVAGRNGDDFMKKYNNNSAVEYHGEVASSKDFILENDLIIVPLFSGSGMRIKIIEGLALGQVMLVTSKAAEGIPVTHDAELWIEDQADAFAAAVAELLSNRSRRQKLKTKAVEFVEKYYNPDLLGAQLYDSYKALVQSKAMQQ